MNRDSRVVCQVLSCCTALLIFAAPLFGQDQLIPTSNPHWSWQNPRQHGEHLGAASFISAREGWAVGIMQGVLHTTDGASTWTAQRFGPPLGFNDVAFRDRNGVAVGNGSNKWGWTEESIIWFTRNGGETWKQSYMDKKGGGFGGVAFSTPLKAWAVGRHGTILRSSDGGKTWDKVLLPKIAKDYDFTDVAFADTMHGLVVGSSNSARNLFMLTEDGGAHWTPVRFRSKGALWHVAFPTPKEAWAVGDFGYIYHSSDGGMTWARQKSPHTSPFIYATSVLFHNSRNGFVTTSDGFVLATSDGGKNWKVSARRVQGINALASFQGKNRFWAFGADGTALRTDDFGATWKVLSKSIREHLLAVSFVSPNFGWAVGTNATILRTGNGGLSWIQCKSPVPSNITLRGVFFVHASRGWVVGDRGKILTTDDGGQTWSVQESGTAENLGAVYFIDTQRGWVGGANRTLLRTEDGGANWKPVSITADIDIYAIKFSDPHHGWAVGESKDRLLRTEDGGDTWTEVEVTFSWLQEAMGLYSLSFINAYEGWTCGAIQVGTDLATLIAHTADGGLTWQEQPLSSGTSVDILRAMVVKPDGRGWAAGEHGTYWTTNDAGNLWTMRVRPTPDALIMGMAFPTNDIGFMVGEGGTILKTNDAGGLD